MTETTTTATDEDTPGSSLELLPPARAVSVSAVATLHDHVAAMRDAKEFADEVCRTQLIPDRFRGKPADAVAAILFGAELGLSPMSSLRSIIVIHGQPGLEARTMKALLKAKGYRFVTHESTNEVCDMEAVSPDGESERCQFTMDDARLAGWVPVETEPGSGKYKQNSNGNLQGNMKYLTEPRTMLRAKATAVVCREIAPHILLGMPYSADEIEDWIDADADDSEKAVPPQPRRPTGRGVGGMRAARERREQRRQQSEANVVDAEVVEDNGTSGEVGADGNWTPEARRKGLNRMHQLFGKGDLPKDAREDRLIVTSKLVGREITSANELADDEIARVNHDLDKLERAGKLGAKITEILNDDAIAKANAAEAAEESAES